MSSTTINTAGAAWRRHRAERSGGRRSPRAWRGRLALLAVAVAAAPLASGCEVRNLVQAGLAVQGQKVVALTFDDGPGPMTRPVLDILDRYGVKATFFVVGRQAAQHPELVAEIVRRGHAVANHTWNHVDLRRVSAARREQEIASVDNLLSSMGAQSRCVRPPYGGTNAAVVDTISRRGEISVLWDVDPQDWRGTPAPQVVSRVMSQLRPGSVVLFHDGGNRANTVAALGPVIEQIRARGYGTTQICP
jgi:peptidoglycan/xylan/chitin deacetylase (PgdA/CDA1 family)